MKSYSVYQASEQFEQLAVEVVQTGEPFEIRLESGSALVVAPLNVVERRMRAEEAQAEDEG